MFAVTAGLRNVVSVSVTDKGLILQIIRTQFMTLHVTTNIYQQNVNKHCGHIYADRHEWCLQ